MHTPVLNLYSEVTLSRITCTAGRSLHPVERWHMCYGKLWCTLRTSSPCMPKFVLWPVKCSTASISSLECFCLHVDRPGWCHSMALHLIVIVVWYHPYIQFSLHVRVHATYLYSAWEFLKYPVRPFASSLLCGNFTLFGYNGVRVEERSSISFLITTLKGPTSSLKGSHLTTMVDLSKNDLIIAEGLYVCLLDSLWCCYFYT